MRYLAGHRILFFGGKGGVGKTTCSAATALSASRRGQRVLLVSTDPAHSIADVVSCTLGPDEREVAERLHALEIDAETEVGRYLQRAKEQMAAAFSPAILKEALRQIEVTATMPGVADVAMFERITDILLTRRQDFDLIVFDTAPTGHTLRLLAMPESMGVWVRALADRRRQAREAHEGIRPGDTGGPPPDVVLDLLDRRASRLDEARTLLASRQAAVVLVLMAERLPIEETARAITMLGGAQLSVAALVVNRLLPDGLEGEFYRSRKTQEKLYLEEIDRRFAALPRVRVLQLPADVRGIADLERIARALEA